MPRLDERLAPVVRELTAAIVRFEWYFKPLQVTSDARKVVLGGLATERADLDARLLLSSAERTVLGLPGLLRYICCNRSPPGRYWSWTIRRQASTTRTLRASLAPYAHSPDCLRPEQIVIATHDE